MVHHSKPQQLKLPHDFWQDKKMKDLSKYLGVASLIAVLIAGANLYGYWRAFGINPFPSLSFQQLIAMSTIPLLQTLGWGTIYNLTFQLFVNSPTYQLELENMSQSSRLRLRRLYILLFGVGTLFYTGFALKSGLPAWWFVIALWVPYLYVELSHKKLVIPIPIKNRVEFLALYFVFSSFVSAYTTGIFEAHELRYPGSQNNAIMTIFGEEQRVKLVGRLGDQFYVYGADKAVSMIPSSEVKKIRFRPGLRIRP
jgi:hypothetical protein